MKVKQIALAILVISLLSFVLTEAYASSRVYACGKGKRWGEFSNLSIDRIECGADGKLSVTVTIESLQDIREEPLRIEEWEAVGRVYFDGREMGTFDIGDPPEIGTGNNTYTYLLPWHIITPVTVNIVVHYTIIAEGEGKGITYNEYASKQEQVEPPSVVSNKIPNYLPILLVGVGLIIIVWSVYQRYGTHRFQLTRLFCHNSRPYEETRPRRK